MKSFSIFIMLLIPSLVFCQSNKGGLKVFIENAEEDDLIGATVQVMDGERQLAGGVTNFSGFVYIPLIEAGTYVVLIRHINIGEAKFQVTIKSNSIYELREELNVYRDSLPRVFIKRNLRAWDYEAKSSSKGDLKIIVENAKEDGLAAVPVQVLDSKQLMASGVTDSSGLLFLPDIDTGTYIVVFKTESLGNLKYQITIRGGDVYELREKLQVRVLGPTVTRLPSPLFNNDPFCRVFKPADILNQLVVNRN